MILYFSATGNCAFAAKRIAEKIGDEAVSLLEKFRENDHTALRSEKPWVVVAPVYVAEMPRLVRDWLRATPLNGSRDIFFVFTCASEMSCSGYFARRLAEEKGMVYHGSASVKMPTNYPIFFTVKEDYECRKGLLRHRRVYRLRQVHDGLPLCERPSGERPSGLGRGLHPLHGLPLVLPEGGHRVPRQDRGQAALPLPEAGARRTKQNHA